MINVIMRNFEIIRHFSVCLLWQVQLLYNLPRDIQLVNFAFTLYVLPDLMKFFSRMLSKAGSSTSSTSSRSTGLPSERESSRCVRKYLWFKDVTCV